MSRLPAFQLWQHGQKTCRITPVTEPPPYLVVILDGDGRVTERSFGDHNDATAYAVEELRRATGFPNTRTDLPNTRTD